MAPRVRYPVPDLDESAGSRYQIRMYRDPDYMGWHDGNRLMDFEVKSIRFEQTHEDDTAWQYQHFLGQGGFGLVGLWAKKDEADNIIDELAVKEMWMPHNEKYRLSPEGRLIPEEPIIQTALQKKNCIPVMQLRGLSILTTSGGHQEKLRYYLEYCPKGTLGGVIRIYDDLLSDDANAENVPEEFLWQLLYNFAQVIVAVERAPFDHPNMQLLGNDPYIIHFDIKAENVMLGNPDDNDIIKGYPSCQIGDWGLAKLTSLSDSRNSIKWIRAGTRNWFPPEQIDENRFGASWRAIPPWRGPSNPSYHAYTVAHSVFQFASVIFRLMVIDRDRSKLNDMISDAAGQEQAVQFRGFQFIESHDMDKNTYGQSTRYTSDLKDTIAQCLNLDPSRRPPGSYLLRISRSKCVEYATHQFQDGNNTFRELRTEEVDPNRGIVRW